MKVVYAVMYSTGYDGPDEIVQLFENEEDAKEYIKEKLKESFTDESDYYLSDYDVI